MEIIFSVSLHVITVCLSSLCFKVSSLLFLLFMWPTSCSILILLLAVSPQNDPYHKDYSSALLSLHCSASLLDSTAIGLHKPFSVQVLFSRWSTKHAVNTWGWSSLAVWSTKYLCFLLLSPSLAMTPVMPCGDGGLSPRARLWDSGTTSHLVLLSISSHGFLVLLSNSSGHFDMVISRNLKTVPLLPPPLFSF